jgi:hypothetical protein
LSRGISVVFSDLDNLWLRMWARNQTPPPQSGAPKAQAAPTSATSYWRSQIFS